MPDLVFPLDSTKKFTEQQLLGHNRWHHDIPAGGDRQAWRQFPGPLPRVVRRRNRERRLRRGHPQRTTDHRAHAQWPDSGRGRQARRPADRRHPRCRAHPARGFGASGRSGLGIHGYFPYGQRRRFPHRTVPRRLQGGVGLRRPDRDLAPCTRGQLHRHRSPRPDGHRAVEGSPWYVEHARGRAHRHRSGSRTAAGAATGTAGRDPRKSDRRRIRPQPQQKPRGRHRRGRTAATRTSRT